MDADRFDTLARTLTDARSRRGALVSLLAGTLGLLGLTEAAAKKKKGKGKKGKGKKKTQPPPLPPPPAPTPQCQVDGDCPTGLNCDSAQHCVCRTNGRCTGCCLSATSCRMADATAADACGINGAACTACGFEVRCDRPTGVCICDAQSTDGCCTADRQQSRPGTMTNACGFNGNICQTCPILEACFDQQCDRV